MALVIGNSRKAKRREDWEKIHADVMLRSQLFP